MSTAHAWLATEAAWWWPRIADHLWQATLFAVLIFAATSALRRSPARVRHALWISASLKLLVPAVFLFFLLERAGINLRSIMTSVLESGHEASVIQSISEPISTLSNSYELTTLSSNAAWHDELYCALSVIWLIGCVSLLIFWIVRRRRFLQTLKLGRVVCRGREWETFRLAKASLGITTPVDLMLAPCRTEPTVARVWKPVVLLPESICEHLNDQELKAIMLHELVHVQRRDNLIGNMQMIVCAFLWFFPPVWFISRKLINEREEACDEKVLKVSGAPEAYASSILKVLRFSFGWKVAGVSGAGNGSNLSRRIKNIMSANNTKRSATSSRIFAGVMITLALMLMVAGGVNTPARNADAIGVGEASSFYEGVIWSLVSSEQRRDPRKTQPPSPPKPPQTPQPAQPTHEVQPAPPPQPSQPAQLSQPAPPAPPSVGTLPVAAAPIAKPALVTPPSPATAPAPPTPETKAAARQEKDS